MCKRVKKGTSQSGVPFCIHMKNNLVSVDSQDRETFLQIVKLTFSFGKSAVVTESCFA